MCNLSLMVARDARVEERVALTVEHVKNLMSTTHSSLETAFNLIGVPEEERELISEVLRSSEEH